MTYESLNIVTMASIVVPLVIVFISMVSMMMLIRFICIKVIGNILVNIIAAGIIIPVLIKTSKEITRLWIHTDIDYSIILDITKMIHESIIL